MDLMQRRKCQKKDGRQDQCFGVVQDEVTIWKLIQLNKEYHNELVLWDDCIQWKQLQFAIFEKLHYKTLQFSWSRNLTNWFREIFASNENNCKFAIFERLHYKTFQLSWLRNLTNWFREIFASNEGNYKMQSQSQSKVLQIILTLLHA